jgi:copper chaperone CopZ
MKNVKGVTGVAAFVKSHSAKIYFDPKLTSPFAIRKAIFTPVITFISEPEKSKNTVTIAEIGIYNFFDANDELLFYEKLKQQGAFYGFETEFGEPIKIRIFFDNGKITPDMIVDIIEKEEIKLKIDGQELIEKTHFKVAQGEVRIADISKSVFYQRMFTPVDNTFNNFDSFSPEQLAVVEIVLPELLIPAMQDKLLYLESHLSGNDGIVRLQTQLNYDKPLLRIHYVIAKVQATEVYKLLSDKKITVYYKKGQTEVMDNPFDIPLHK